MVRYFSASFPELSISALLPWEANRKEMNANSDMIAVPIGPTTLKQEQKFAIKPKAFLEENVRTVDKIASSIELFGTEEFLPVSLFDEDVEIEDEEEAHRVHEEDDSHYEDYNDYEYADDDDAESDDDEDYSHRLTSIHSSDMLKVDDGNLKDIQSINFYGSNNH